MTRRQKRIFGTFLALIMISQCVSVVVSFAASADALRVWISPHLVRGSEATLRTVVVGDGDLQHRKGVQYRVVLQQQRRELQLIEKRVEDQALDLWFLVPHWDPGPARLRIEAQYHGVNQVVHVQVQLSDQPALGVLWSSTWAALAGVNPMDPADEAPKRAERLPVEAFPLTGWAVSSFDLPLVLRRKSGAWLRVRREGEGGVGTLFDAAGFAQITIPQPLHRGRYRVQVADGTGAWASHDLWLHNPPSELQLLTENKEVKPGEELSIAVRSDNRRERYQLQIYHGGQWQSMVTVPMNKGRGELRLRAPKQACWLSIAWASDLVTDSRRRAFVSLRVGDAPLPAGVPDRLAHPGTPLGRAALLSRIRPLLLQPPLRADTTALRKAQVLEQKMQRQRWANLVFQLLATAFVAWLCLNILAMQVSRTRSRKALLLEMEEAEALAGNPFQTLGTIMVLLGLLCLLFVISYLFNTMVWGW